MNVAVPKLTLSSGVALPLTKFETARLPEAPTAALEIEAEVVLAPLIVGSVPAPAAPTEPVSVTPAELSLMIASVAVDRLVVGAVPAPSTMLVDENDADEPTAATEMPLAVPPLIAPP